MKEIDFSTLTTELRFWSIFTDRRSKHLLHLFFSLYIFSLNFLAEKIRRDYFFFTYYVNVNTYMHLQACLSNKEK